MKQNTIRIFKTKLFAKWASKEKILDSCICNAVDEVSKGIVDADLGGNIFKKRISVGNKGKSSGIRTIMGYKKGDKAFFIYGFAKSAKSNVTTKELQALKAYAKLLFRYTDSEIHTALEAEEIYEVSTSLTR